MTLTIILLILFVIVTIAKGVVLFIIKNGVGFNMAWVYFRAYFKKKKGFGVGVFYANTGIAIHRLVDLNRDTFKIELYDEKEALFNVRRDCINFNVAGIPIIMYPANEADPFNPVKGMPTVTDPTVQQATLAKLNIAETTYNGEFEWLKKNWIYIGIFILIFVGIFGFVLMHQNDSLVLLAQQVGSSAIITPQNVTMLGK